ncbi:hypothetical protein V6Z12_D05G100200 [Gossypium hirsutum]
MRYDPKLSTKEEFNVKKWQNFKNFQKKTKNRGGKERAFECLKVVSLKILNLRGHLATFSSHYQPKSNFSFHFLTVSRQPEQPRKLSGERKSGKINYFLTYKL